jgi:hypothetical protein
MADPKEPEEIRQACVRKLKNIETSPPFTAMIACLLNEDWTSPRILQLHITPDRCLLARTEDNIEKKQECQGRKTWSETNVCPRIFLLRFLGKNWKRK